MIGRSNYPAAYTGVIDRETRGSLSGKAQEKVVRIHSDRAVALSVDYMVNRERW